MTLIQSKTIIKNWTARMEYVIGSRTRTEYQLKGIVRWDGTQCITESATGWHDSEGKVILKLYNIVSAIVYNTVKEIEEDKVRMI